MIKYIATADEQTSPYFQKNKAYAENWQQFINTKQGKIIAKVGAAALILKAQIKTKAIWDIEIQKTTQTIDSILIPSKYFVSDVTKISARNYKLDKSSFQIFRKNFLSFLKVKFNKNYHYFFQNTILHSNESKTIKEWDFWETSSLKSLKKLTYDKERETLRIQFNKLFDDFSFLTKMIFLDTRL